MLAATRQLRRNFRLKSSAAFKRVDAESEQQEFAQLLADRIASNKEACTSIVEGLNTDHRSKLLQAILAADSAKGASTSSANKEYLDSVFKQSDTNAPFGSLDRLEFEAALQADRARQAMANPDAPPQTLQPSFFSIALANSIPFVGMGAVDNAIMLVAGSRIDAAFGAKLGLSTLAAAGLGNIVSDVAGVSMANRLENWTRSLKWINQAAYKAGNKTPNGRTAKLSGAVAGVTLGCLIGMLPLLFMDTHEYDDPAVHPEAQRHSQTS